MAQWMETWSPSGKKPGSLNAECREKEAAEMNLAGERFADFFLDRSSDCWVIVLGFGPFESYGYPFLLERSGGDDFWFPVVGVGLGEEGGGFL